MKYYNEDRSIVDFQIMFGYYSSEEYVQILIHG